MRLSRAAPGRVLHLCQQDSPSSAVDPRPPSRACLFKAGPPITWRVCFMDYKLLIKIHKFSWFLSPGFALSKLLKKVVSSKPPASPPALESWLTSPSVGDLLSTAEQSWCVCFFYKGHPNTGKLPRPMRWSLFGKVLYTPLRMFQARTPAPSPYCTG